MPSRDAEAILVLEEHVLKCRVQTRGMRLLETLNDQSTDFLNIYDADVSRKACNTCIASFPEAVVPKARIGLAIVVGDKHEAPEKRRNNVLAKRRYSAFLLALGYEIRGKLYLQGSADPVSTFSHELGRFVPVAEGTVRYGGRSDEQFQGPVVIVNKGLASLVQICEQVTPPADLSELVREIVNK